MVMMMMTVEVCDGGDGEDVVGEER
jgi:hypothetical protein